MSSQKLSWNQSPVFLSNQKVNINVEYCVWKLLAEFPFLDQRGRLQLLVKVSEILQAIVCAPFHASDALCIQRTFPSIMSFCELTQAEFASSQWNHILTNIFDLFFLYLTEEKDYHMATGLLLFSDYSVTISLQNKIIISIVFQH